MDRSSNGRLDRKVHASPYTKTPTRQSSSNHIDEPEPQSGLRGILNFISSPFKSTSNALKQSLSPPKQPQFHPNDEPMQIEELGGRDQTEDLIDWRKPDPGLNLSQRGRQLSASRSSLLGSQSPQQTNEALSQFFREKGQRSLTSEEAVECFKLIGSSIQPAPPNNVSQNLPSVALFSPGSTTTNNNLSSTRGRSGSLFSSSRPQRAGLGGAMTSRKRPIYMGAGFGNSLSQSKRRESMEAVGRSIGIGPRPSQIIPPKIPPPQTVESGKKRKTEEKPMVSKSEELPAPKVQLTPQKTSHLSVSRYTKPANVIRPSPLRQVQTADSPSPEKEKTGEYIPQQTPSKPSSRAADAVLGILETNETKSQDKPETINPYQNNNPVALISKARTPRPSKLRKSLAPTTQSDLKPKENEASANALDLIEQTDPNKNKNELQNKKVENESKSKSTIEEPSINIYSNDTNSKNNDTIEIESDDDIEVVEETNENEVQQPPKFSAFQLASKIETPKIEKPAEDKLGNYKSVFSNVETSSEKQQPSQFTFEKPKEEKQESLKSSFAFAKPQEKQSNESSIFSKPTQSAFQLPQSQQSQSTSTSSPFGSFNNAFTTPTNNIFGTNDKSSMFTIGKKDEKVEEKLKEKEEKKDDDIEEDQLEEYQEKYTEKEETKSPKLSKIVDEKDAKDKVNQLALEKLPKFTFNSLNDLQMTNISKEIKEGVNNIPQIKFTICLDNQESSNNVNNNVNPLWAAAKKANEGNKTCGVCGCSSPSTATDCTVCESKL